MVSGGGDQKNAIALNRKWLKSLSVYFEWTVDRGTTGNDDQMCISAREAPQATNGGSTAAAPRKKDPSKS